MWRIDREGASPKRLPGTEQPIRLQGRGARSFRTFVRPPGFVTPVACHQRRSGKKKPGGWWGLTPLVTHTRGGRLTFWLFLLVRVLSRFIQAGLIWDRSCLLAFVPGPRATGLSRIFCGKFSWSGWPGRIRLPALYSCLESTELSTFSGSFSIDR